MNQPLANDSCPDTRRAEFDFVAERRLAPYDDTVAGDASHRVVIISRALGTRYEWPRGESLTAEHLRPFSEIGHTLGLDYLAMYTRNFALDLDCVCRVNKRTMSHLNEPLLQKIIATVTDTLKQLFEMTKPPRCSVWRKRCGFHLYYDLPVSLETHLLIGRIIGAKYSSHDVCVEVPTIMPLPYSAKTSRDPYLPLLPTQQEYPLTPNFDDAHHTLFEYSQAFAATLSCLKISTRVGEMYCNRTTRPRKKFGGLSIKHVRAVTVLPGYEYMEPLVAHVNHMALRESASQLPDDLLRSDVGNIQALKNDPELMNRFTGFMAKFNKLFTDSDSLDCDAFVNFALLTHHGLHMQHYVVLLNKSLEPITDAAMRETLGAIFSGVGDDPVVKRFVEHYDSRTLNCYSDSAEVMMAHLHFLYANNVSPFDTVSEQLDKLMQTMLCEESSETFRHGLLEMDADQRKAALNQAIAVYCKIAIEMRVVMYNIASSNYYVLSDLGTHYKISAKQESYPTVFNWVGGSKARKEAVFGEMEILRPKYSIDQTVLLSRSKFQISTTTGVFNSAMGLYVSKSRFLRFLCYRDTAVWDLNASRAMYPRQNYKIVERYETVVPYVKMLFDDSTPMFVHFLLAPAFIQLRRIHHIEEYQIKSLIDMLTKFKSLECAHFLIEYFPIDPKFIFLVMYIYTTYDNFSTLGRYQAMSDHIFHVFDSDQVDHKAWTEKFDPIIATMTYEQRDSHLATLLTIDHEQVNQVSEDFCLYATLLAVCFMKCRAYKTLCEAFDMTELPPPRSEHPEYARDFSWDTDLTAASSHLHRAIRIVFPGHHDDFEQNLIISMFVTAMSTYFDPEITRELIVSISATFLSSNVLKKCFLMWGPSGTGKSHFSDLLQMMTSPKVGRYTSLNEAMDRSNVTLKNNIIIINEVKVVDGDKIKAVTGNDAESTKQFYSQEYEMHTNQSLIYGATNSVISFRGNSYIDSVSVNRFHAIKLCGQQMPSSFKSVSMFSMMANSQLFSGTVRPTECEISSLAIGVGWLSFVSYMLYRDENLYPRINVDAACNQEYCELVYRSNNKLYDFLVNNGIIVAPGFHMRAERLISTAKLALRSAKLDATTNCAFSSFHEFKRRFESCGFPLEQDGTVQNFQEAGLVHHIRRNMCVSESRDSVITQNDIIERTIMYTDSVDRENAESYFARENKDYYVHAEGVYRHIEFVQLPVSYENSVGSAATKARGGGGGITASSSTTAATTSTSMRNLIDVHV